MSVNQQCTGGGVLLVPQHEIAPAIYRFYKKHPQKNRRAAAAFVLTYHFDMTRAEVAAVLNVCVKSAYNYVDSADVMHARSKAFRAECAALCDYIVGYRKWLPYDKHTSTEKPSIRTFTPYQPKRKKSS